MATSSFSSKESILVQFAAMNGLDAFAAAALPAVWDVLAKQGFVPAEVFAQAVSKPALALYIRNAAVIGGKELAANV